MHVSHWIATSLACLIPTLGAPSRLSSAHISSTFEETPIDAAMSAPPDGGELGTIGGAAGERGGAGSSSSTLLGVPGAAYCTGDGLDPVVTALCPNGNFGHPGQGCGNNNMSLGGALLSATGTTNPNTILFHCDTIPMGSFCAFVSSTSSVPTGYVVGLGVSCAAGTLVRFRQQNSGTGGVGPFSTVASAPTVGPGNTRYYQVHYRLVSGTFNASNGYVITW